MLCSEAGFFVGPSQLDPLCTEKRCNNGVHAFWGRFGIRVKLGHKLIRAGSRALSEKAHLAGRAVALTIPLNTCRSLDRDGRLFSGRLGWLLAHALGHKELDRLAALHQTIGPTRFSGQPVPCDRVLHVSRTYPSLDTQCRPIPGITHYIALRNALEG